jgi:cytochrome c556
LKAEWQDRARADGVSLSHVLRTSCRIAMLAGPTRLRGTMKTIRAMRRDLHGINAELQKLADGRQPVDLAEIRAAVARVHVAAEAAASFLQRR